MNLTVKRLSQKNLLGRASLYVIIKRIGCSQWAPVKYVISVKRIPCDLSEQGQSLNKPMDTMTDQLHHDWPITPRLTIRVLFLNGEHWSSGIPSFENASRVSYANESKPNKRIGVGVHGLKTNQSRTLAASTTIFQEKIHIIDLCVRKKTNLNEMTDDLGKQRADIHFLEPEPFVGVSNCHL